MAAWTKIVGAAVVESSFILNTELTSFADRLDVEWREKVLFCFPVSTWKNDAAICRDRYDYVWKSFEEEFGFVFGLLFEIPTTSN